MQTPILIRKVGGVTEPFSRNKLSSSLHKVGASDVQVREIVEHIEGELQDGITTDKIYKHALELLSKSASKVALKYSMRRALLEFGPDGFPFEKFVAEIYKAKGFIALTDQIVYGTCVEHEMDVVAWSDNELYMVEAKFHNEQGFKSDLKTALYVKARFDDLKGAEFDYGGKKRPLTRGLLITNTKFTDHAIRYGECVGLAMVGWNYPETGSLESLIEEAGLHPVTCLPSLSGSQKRALVEKGIILCKDLLSNEGVLKEIGYNESKISGLVEEARTLCKM